MKRYLYLLISNFLVVISILFFLLAIWYAPLGLQYFLGCLIFGGFAVFFNELWKKAKRKGGKNG